MITKNDLLKTLEAPLLYWSTASKELISLFLGKKAADMVGFDQRSPHHCYTLFEHCIHTVDHINSEENNVMTDTDLLRVAAFFHDIAKPQVAFEKNGRLVFYGHAHKSADMAEGLLINLGFDTEEISLICFFIKHHDDFISYELPDEVRNKNNNSLAEITKERILKHIRAKSNNELNYPQKNIWNDLMLLCLADASSQAEEVYMNGILTDSKQHKLRKMEKIQDIINNYME